jgi:phospholipid/cholesterol/gamma-HCH transport system substrate-binding protein
VKPQTAARIAAVLALTIVVVAVAALIESGGSNYKVRAVFSDMGGLVKGFRVRIDGAAVGTVSNLALNKQDQVVATLELDKSAAPVGMNATATVRAADLLGEKYIDVQPGNRADAAPSGTTIPVSRTGIAVELDDVLNAIDPPTQQALRVLLNEQGLAFAGRGQDLASVLATLPPSLDQAQQLVLQLAQNNGSLEKLLSESDRVVSAVTAQRGSLERLVGSTSGTLGILAGRRAELGQTVANAAPTLSSLRSALAALQNAAAPLGPAAVGLASTAPQLTATLEQLPKFTEEASPALTAIRDTSPTLTTLGIRGTPVVRRLRPLTSQLGTFASALQPVGTTLDRGIGDVLGLMEGWARSTQGRDTAGHVFRFGLTVSPATFSSLATLLSPATKKASRPAAVKQVLSTVLNALTKPAPAPRTPTPPVVNSLKQLVPALTNTIKNVSATLTKATTQLTAPVNQTVAQAVKALQQLGIGSGSPSGQAPTLKELLSYLLR